MLDKNKPEVYFMGIKKDELTKKYYLEINKNNKFESLTALVQFYRASRIETKKIPSFVLGFGVHKNTISIDEDWYIIDQKKEDCENTLIKYRKNGAFFIRTPLSHLTDLDKSMHVYTLTFFCCSQTYDAKIYVEKDNYCLKFYINNKYFKCLKDIVSYYRENSVYKSQKLTIGLQSLLKTKNSQVSITNGNYQENNSLNDVSINFKYNFYSILFLIFKSTEVKFLEINKIGINNKVNI